jgi:hypothetical protein
MVFTPHASSSNSHESNYMILEPTQAKVDIEASKKWKKVYELKCQFQNTWATQLPLGKFVVGVDGGLSTKMKKLHSD